MNVHADTDLNRDEYMHELVYRHLVPRSIHWEELQQGHPSKNRYA